MRIAPTIKQPVELTFYRQIMTLQLSLTAVVGNHEDSAKYSVLTDYDDEIYSVCVSTRHAFCVKCREIVIHRGRLRP